MSKHSPRPWSKGEDGEVYDANGELVAVVEYSKDHGLITAAPVLLQWVKAYRDHMDDSEGELAALLARIDGKEGT